MQYNTRYDLKNRNGGFKDGRKITGISFLSKSRFLASTADNRIRLFDLDVINIHPLKSYNIECLKATGKI